MGARYYDAATGRFLSEDPLFLEIGGGKFGEMLKRNQYKLKSPDIIPESLVGDSSRSSVVKVLAFDFLGQPQLMNSYGYVSDNPLKYTDPTGESQSAERVVNYVNGRGWHTDAQLTDSSKIPSVIASPQTANQGRTYISSPGHALGSSTLSPGRPAGPSYDQRRDMANGLDHAAQAVDTVGQAAGTPGAGVTVTVSVATAASAAGVPQAGIAVAAAYPAIEFGLAVASNLAQAVSQSLDALSNWLMKP